MMLTTPRNASAPYSAEAGPRMISICAIDSSGISSDAQPVAGRGAVSDRAAVDHHLDDAALRSEAAGHAAHAGVGQDVIVDEVEADRVVQDLCDRLVAPALDVPACHQRDDRRRFVHALGGLAGGGHLHVEELYQVQIVDDLGVARAN
jgi:hypothetical protein